MNTDSYFLLSMSVFHKIFEKQSLDDICYKYLMLPIVKMTFSLVITNSLIFSK